MARPRDFRRGGSGAFLRGRSRRSIRAHPSAMPAPLDGDDRLGERHPEVWVTATGPPPPLRPGAARALLAIVVAAVESQRAVAPGAKSGR